MEKRGVVELPEKQMGGMLVYSNGIEQEELIFSVNEYYSKWIWQ